jgi:hypothetical protein
VDLFSPELSDEKQVLVAEKNRLNLQLTAFAEEKEQIIQGTLSNPSSSSFMDRRRPPRSG